jgi:hypothetical protein
MKKYLEIHRRYERIVNNSRLSSKEKRIALSELVMEIELYYEIPLRNQEIKGDRRAVNLHRKIICTCHILKKKDSLIGLPF